MKRLFMALTASLTLAVIPSVVVAQARPDFSGNWRFNQDKSSPRSFGNEPKVNFPSVLVVKQTPTEMHVQMGTVRQEPVSAVYKFDGSEVAVGAPEGIKETAKVSWDGGKLVIAGRRSFSSPILGEVVSTTREIWTLNGSVLTVEKTRTAEGLSDTETAVYDKTGTS